MRITVTLEKDVEQMLREAMHRSRKSFKQTFYIALRRGLGGQARPPKARPFVIKARSLGLRAGIDPAGFNKLADDFELDSFLKQHMRSRRS